MIADDRKGLREAHAHLAEAVYHLATHPRDLNARLAAAWEPLQKGAAWPLPPDLREQYEALVLALQRKPAVFWAC
jgi:hypothetical protein